MSLYKTYDSQTDSLALEVISGKEDITTNIWSSDIKMHFSVGLPGIVWFDTFRTVEYEVLDYRWDGPRYQEVMIQDSTSDTKTRGGRKGRVAGALIGTMIMPGIGTVIGAAVGTGRKENSRTQGVNRSHIETQEGPVVAQMRLRNIANDEIINIGFKCTSSLDTRIRNNITVNLDNDVIDYTAPAYLPEPEQPKETKDTKDILTQIRELKELLDDGAITQEEYEMLKKKLL